nr:hypothetical protein [Acetobacter garciniae]
MAAIVPSFSSTVEAGMFWCEFLGLNGGADFYADSEAAKHHPADYTMCMTACRRVRHSAHHFRQKKKRFPEFGNALFLGVAAGVYYVGRADF